ncbi:hypothetical protein V6N13_047271 [Hibiscus sabdariffa]|uniref:Agglutinin domain-containing protein n=2 Tax=Hibiscus sabdariffa TaxID=183260 RepID=A0ABR2F3L6_9ROSI
MASASALATDLTLPRFIALGFSPKGYYLSFVRDGGKMDACIRFVDTEVTSPYAKFEVELASADGLFYIRSCRNNKYWERNRHPEKHWITATASKKEEDQSNLSCTLFRFISVDPVMNTVRVVHIQSGYYLCLCGVNDPITDCCVYAISKVYDNQGCDIFQLIDWSSLLVLPKHVALKGDNDFDDSDTTNNNKDALFRPVKVDDKTVGLINLGNNYFCKRLTADGKTNCLNAAVPSVTKDAQLTVEEPVLTREIYGVKYKLDYSRVYGETVLIVARNSASNYNQQASTLDVKLSYTDTRTSTWKTMFNFTEVRFESHHGVQPSTHF